MGENGYWSWIFSVLFILFGAIMIFVNHLVRFLLRKKKNIKPKFEGNKKTNLIASFASIEGVSLIILVVGIILMASGKLNTSSLSYDSFNVGILLLVIGVSLILIGVSQFLYLLENNNPNKENITDEQI